MKAEVRRVKLSEIQFDNSVYPRKDHSIKLVQKYQSCLAEIEARSNFMSVAEDLTLLDGRHRYLAYLNAYEKEPNHEIDVYVYPVSEGVDKFHLSIELNIDHGRQYSDDDKEHCAIKDYIKYHESIEAIAKRLSVRKATVLEWTKKTRDEEEKQLNELIFDMHLACYTQDEIVEAVKEELEREIDRTTVGDKIRELCEKFPGTKSTQLSKYEEDDWKPPLYDIWNVSANRNEAEIFGNTPVEFVDNLLYTFTEQFDIVVDPFAGAASTRDVCIKRLRRYWVSDRKISAELEDRVRLHDIVTDGIPGPARWADVALVYLDPPYWKQAEGKYSDDPTDLANMPLDEFTSTLIGIIHDYAKKLPQGAHIACIISPTQWPNDDKSVNYHDIDLACGISKKLQLVRRVICPYSTQQYNGTQVDMAKEQKLWLVISRTMLIWQVV